MTKTRWLHLGMMIFWVLMIIPTLTIWKESILLVLLMSLYANIEASATAFLTANPQNGNIVKSKKRIRGSVNVSHRGNRISKKVH